MVTTAFRRDDPSSPAPFQRSQQPIERKRASLLKVSCITGDAASASSRNIARVERRNSLLHIRYLVFLRLSGTDTNSLFLSYLSTVLKQRSYRS